MRRTSKGGGGVEVRSPLLNQSFHCSIRNNHRYSLLNELRARQRALLSLSNSFIENNSVKMISLVFGKMHRADRTRMNDQMRTRVLSFNSPDFNFSPAWQRNASLCVLRAPYMSFQSQEKKAKKRRRKKTNQVRPTGHRWVSAPFVIRDYEGDFSHPRSSSSRSPVLRQLPPPPSHLSQ